MFGAVVVGVGTAGGVRIRDILAPLPGSSAEQLTLKGFISRRKLEAQQGVQQISLEEAVSREDIQVVFICTENTAHEDNIRAFLQAGKHVCVEYPMSLSRQAAEELCALAHQKGVVLHEEHIELLSADFLQLKRDVSGRTLLEGSLHFTGGPLKPGFGFPAFCGIARLHWLVDLFGQLSVTAATLEERPDGYMRMSAELVTADNRPLRWIEERGPGLSRAKNIDFRFDSGSLTQVPPGPPAAVRLFMQDLVLFTGKLTGQAGPGDSQRERERVLHCLEVAGRIQQLSRE